MQTSKQRLLSLKAVFTKRNMLIAWKTVRNGLRNQDLDDLHDYLDVHRNRDAFVWRLRADVLTGRYRPNEATIISLEKKHGIGRRLMLPTPADALLLQTLVNAIEPRLRRRQPSKAAHYARSHRPPAEDSVDATFPYPWWQLWPQFQQRIWNFTNVKAYVVVTDVANYFDSIPLGTLRDSVASLARLEQPVLDFLFFLLEAFVWRPDYIPLSGVGLPQLNFDAPRLLGHCYLFPIDRLIDSATQAHYVRWMDDINFGVDSESDARALLSNIDTRLNMLGVRLNVAKTKILSATQAQSHFQLQENRQLTILGNSYQYGSRSTLLRQLITVLLEERYDRFRAAPRDGAWTKVLKRYYTVFGKAQHDVLEAEVPTHLKNYADVRASIFRYYRALGFSIDRLDHIHDYITDHCTDDASLFGACRLLTEWEIAVRSVGRARMITLAGWLRLNGQNRVSAFCGGLWLLAKYGSTRRLWDYIQRTGAVWQRSAWAARVSLAGWSGS